MARTRFRIYPVFLHLTLVALMGLVWGLIYQDRGPDRGGPKVLASGDRLPSLAALRLDGSETTLSFSPNRAETLLLVFTTTCPVCEKNAEAWISLYERFHKEFKILGVAVDDVEAAAEYSARLGLPYPVLVPSDVASFPKDYRVPAVPTTIRLDRGGRVEDVWTGLLTDAQIDDLVSVETASTKDSSGAARPG